MAVAETVEQVGADATIAPLDTDDHSTAIDALANLVYAKTAALDCGDIPVTVGALDSEAMSPDLHLALALFRKLSETPAGGISGGIAELGDHLVNLDRQLQQRRDRHFLESHGVITGGEHRHFEYTSGRHGMHYAEKFRLLEQPAVTAELCMKIASFARGLDEVPRVIVGPVTGGIIVAYETARQMGGGVRAFFAEANGHPDQLDFGRGFSFKKGEPVLVVDDVLTTGGSLRKTVDAVRAAKGQPVGVAVLINRSKIIEGEFQDLPFQACLTVDLPQFEPGAETCPQCADSIPVESPKS